MKLSTSAKLLTLVILAAMIGCTEKSVTPLDGPCVDLSGTYRGKDSAHKDTQILIQQKSCNELILATQSGPIQIGPLTWRGPSITWHPDTECAPSGTCTVVGFEKTRFTVGLARKAKEGLEAMHYIGSLTPDNDGNLAAKIGIRNKEGNFDSQTLVFRKSD